MRKIDDGKIFRIIDANLNRAKEGLRVCEDVSRFILDSKKQTRDYKAVRHTLESIFKSLFPKKAVLISQRDVSADVGRPSTAAEFQRRNVRDIFYANSQRAKESLRVLEEFTKLLNVKSAQAFKELRYKVYVLEKDIVKKF